MEDDNTRYIAEQIFSKPPGTPNSINLQLDETTVDFVQSDNVDINKLILQIVSTITLHGVEILFGHKNLLELSENDLFLLKRYVLSYGYEMKVKIDNSVLRVGFKKHY